MKKLMSPDNTGHVSFSLFSPHQPEIASLCIVGCGEKPACSLPAADAQSCLSLLNQIKMSELQVAADRSSASAWGEFHNLTGSLLNLPLCAAYNDSPPMSYSWGCYLFVANVAKNKRRSPKQKRWSQQKAQEWRDVLTERGNFLKDSLSFRQHSASRSANTCCLARRTKGTCAAKSSLSVSCGRPREKRARLEGAGKSSWINVSPRWGDKIFWT